MKQKIRISYTKNNKQKIIEHEFKIRDYDHFESQLKNKSHVFRNKKKYTRKIKHKNVEYI